MAKKILEKTNNSNIHNLEKSIEDGVNESQINDLIEFYREEHAEEAIIACARTGNQTRKSILYCTAFPCHLCIKKIVAAGIEKVIYIEPYPKSKTYLFEDSVEINNNLTGPHANSASNNEKVIFEQFKGVGPTRYLDLFSLNISNGIRVKRKAEDLLKSTVYKPRMHKIFFSNLINNFLVNEEIVKLISLNLDEDDPIKKIILKLQKINDYKKIYESKYSKI